MFVVMFEFVVQEGFEEQFIKAWPSVTQGIYLFKGSLGSRLHKNVNGEYIAYAQWPDKQTWEASSEIEMSPDYEMHRDSMQESLNLESTRVLYQMEVEIDYLQRRKFAL
ncbi:antibiotic biosynthesis monooxygenase [Pseudoalteromonas luteoviolacea]|uniref:antibiotic biosynthesis monooxygenase family protein n=1 Tax=Pseudoalteromonas luteoviolacea TaxID=43657 RepID=UPI0031BB71CE|nr:antibiotic biosynthesis monooxygenase [Pseudoalteromonas luteoviolacea]